VDGKAGWGEKGELEGRGGEVRDRRGREIVRQNKSEEKKGWKKKGQKVRETGGGKKRVGRE
jgi:hypothetical protein